MPPASLPDELVALLHAARAQPEDAPRLVLADWLEEHGGPADQARAELIRVQCQLARSKEGDDGHLDLTIREEALLARNRSAWLGPLPGAGGQDVSAHRGLFRLEFPPHRQKLHGDLRSLVAQPAFDWVESVQIRNGPMPTVRRLFESPTLESLTGLYFSDLRMGDEGLRLLVESPHLTNLFSLQLWRNDLTSEAGRILAGSPRLHRLHLLELWQSPLRAAGLEPLLASPLVEGLRFLALGQLDLGPDGTRLVAECPGLRRLEELQIRLNETRDAGARALADAPHLGGLRRLFFTYNGLTSDGVAAVLGSSRFASLEDLNVGYNQISGEVFSRGLPVFPLRRLGVESCGLEDSGVADLAQAPLLGLLTFLDLATNRVGDAGATALGRSPHVGQLRSLELTGNHISSAGGQELARGRFSSLVHLDLGSNNLDARAAAALIGSTSLPALRSLSLSSNPLGVEADAFGRLPGLSRLGYLNLNRTQVGGGIEHLLGSRHLTGMRRLNLSGNPLVGGAGERLANNSALGGLVVLEVEDCGLTDADAVALTRSPHLTALSRVRAARNPLTQVGLDALRARFGPDGVR